MADNWHGVDEQFDPTPSQRQAMQATDRNVMVTAGPGSGKTRVLVGRIETLLEEGVAPGRIAAITFTNKAAAQMNERLRGRLRSRWLAALNEGRTERARFWRSLVWDMEYIFMGTIHSFCAGILRDAPHRAGLDPNFQVLDPYIGAELLDRIIEETVNDTLEQPDTRLHAWVEERQSPSRNKASYRGLIRNIYENIRRSGSRPSELTSRTQTALYRAFCRQGGDPSIWEQDALEPTPEEVDQIHRWVEALLRAHEDGVGGNTKRYPPILERLSRDWPELSREFEQRNRALEGLRFLADRLKLKPPKALAPYVEPITKMNYQKEMIEEKQLMNELASILETVDFRFRQAKGEREAIDFNDHDEQVLAVLNQYPEALSRLRRRYTHLLVDEFQDTDGMQWALVRTLWGIWEEERPHGLFLVGDADQSIYRFRGADVEVFRKAHDQMATLGQKTVRLDKNFRSTPAMIALFNTLFPAILPDYQPLTPGGGAVGKAVPAELLMLRRDQDDARDDLRRNQGTVIANWIKEWTDNGGKPGDIAILARAANALGPVADALSKQDIPHRVIGERTFFDTQVMRDFQSLLRWLADERDDQAFLALLRSPFCAVDDEILYQVSKLEGLRYTDKIQASIEKGDPHQLQPIWTMMANWSNLKDQLSLSELLSAILDHSFYREVTAASLGYEKGQAILDKAVGFARRMEAEGLDLPSFARQLSALWQGGSPGEEQPEPELADEVRLMTIHKAKGLEFPVVILPEMDKRIDARVEFVVSKEAGLGVKWGRDFASVQFNRLKPEEKNRILEEERRIFYVACTRAEEKLVFLGGLGKEDSKRQDIHDPHEISSEKSSYLGWILAACPDTLAEGISWQIVDPPDGKSTVSHDATDADDHVLALAKNAVSEGLMAPVTPAGTKSGRVYSVTALVDFAHCPRLYLLKHRLNWPLLPKVGDSKEKTAVDPLLLGTVVHRVCELMPEENAEQALVTALSEANVMVRSPVGMELQRRARALIAPYLHSTLFSEIEAAFQRGRLYNEWAFSLPLEHRKDRVYLAGKVDQIFEDSAGNWCLVDYKTDRIRSEDLSERGQSYALQLALYRWVVTKILSLSIGETFLYFLYPRERYHPPLWDDDILQERLMGLLDHLQTATCAADFPLRSSHLCTWCDYAFHCRRESDRTG